VASLEQFEALADLDGTRTALALAWLLMRPGVTASVLGPRALGQLTGSPSPAIGRGGYRVRRVVTITLATKSSSTIDTGAQTARSAVLLVMILRTTATAE
jgi:hypothetical protein